MFYDYESKTLDLTCVRMAQEKTKLVERNKRAMEYSEMCEQRNKAKHEAIGEMVMNIVIMITICFALGCIIAVTI